jgi:ABC-2 type transport system permease protein
MKSGGARKGGGLFSRLFARVATKREAPVTNAY